MNVAIIGAGRVGSALAAALIRAGHRVFVAARTLDHARSAADVTGAETAAGPAAAASLADVVILAVPFSSAEKVALEIRPVINGKTVVDVTNPVRPDSSGPLFGGTDSGAERIAAWLPHAHVVKAFNTVLAGNLSEPARNGVTLDGFVAADDPDAKARVLELAASLGLNPVDAGPLTAARQLESLAWLNISLNQQPGWTWRTGWKLVGAPTAAPATAGARTRARAA